MSKTHNCSGENCKICKKSKYMIEWRKKNHSKNIKYQKEYFQKYYEQKKDKIIAQTKEYYLENKDKQNARKKEYKNENKEYFSALQKKYWRDNKHILGPKNKMRYEENSERYNKAHYENWKKPKYHSDERYKLKEVISARIRQALLHDYKSASTMKLIGCSIPELKAHLERQFTEGMSWENHAITGWHIDHIKPCNSFDLKDPEQQKACFHFSNLQPLWYDVNIRKGTKVFL